MWPYLGGMAVRLEDLTLDDVARDLARQKLAAMYKSAMSKRDLVKWHLSNGTNPEYVAMRYGLKPEDVLKAKRVWDAEEASKAEIRGPSRHGVVRDLPTDRPSGKHDSSLQHRPQENSVGASEMPLRGVPEA